MRILRDHVNEKSEEPFFLYYSSQAPHTPFDAPQDVIDKFGDTISDTSRQTLAAVMTVFESVVGDIVEYLQSDESGNLWDNTLFIFSTDNGGDVTEGASNFPLRFVDVMML